MATAPSLTVALANSTSPAAPNLRRALAGTDSRDSFGCSLSPENVTACWAKRLTRTAPIGTRKIGASADSASTMIAPESAGPPGPRIIPVSRSGWATKIISTDAACCSAKAPTVATTASSAR